MAASQQRLARPTLEVGQATNPARPAPKGGQADNPAQPAPKGGQADFHESGSGPSSVHVLRTFVPQRPEIGTWKTNIEKNKGKIVKKPCTFDRPMAKYKEQKADFKNQPLKTRESTPLRLEDKKTKQLVVSQVAAPVQKGVAPRVSRWGPPISPQWGPHGVWVPYPPLVPNNVQPRGGELAGPSSKPTVFSRLSVGQSSSRGANQVVAPQRVGRTLAQQVWLPKKVEVPAVPPPNATPIPTITIGSMEAPIKDDVGRIVIGSSTPASVQAEASNVVAEVEEKKRPKRDPRYTQPKWCPRGLNKNQRRKLQRARCKQQKREMLGMLENNTPTSISTKGQPGTTTAKSA